MLRELSLRLDRDKFEPIVCSLRPAGRVAREIAASGITVFSLDLPERPGVLDLLSGIVRLARAFDEHRVDLVQALLYRANFMAPLSARLSSRRPPVVSGHRSLAPLQGRVAVFSARLTQRLASAVVANSEAVRDHIVAHEGARRERVEVIYNGVDLERFQGRDRTEIRASLGLDDATLVFGAAGRMMPVKAYDDLLRALARIDVPGVPTMLVLAGDGDERPRLEELARQLGVEERVRFLGFRQDIADLYRAFDVFVLSSLREGFPNVVIEAMASGCPVVATRVGGVAEIVEHEESGLVVPAGAPEALGEALERLVHDPELRRRLALAGRRRVEQRFALERSIEAHERFYTAVLAGQPRLADRQGVS